MKKVLFLIGLVAALLCLSQSANAQYARKGANLVDQNGVVLTDQQIINLVGNDIFDQTVVGARKQYKVGNGLLWGGLAGMVIGAGGFAYTTYKLAENTGGNVDDIASAMVDEPGVAAVYIGSMALMSLGGTLFSAGIIFKSIGKGRLNWVEEQANAAKGYSINFGPTPHGAGVVVRF